MLPVSGVVLSAVENALIKFKFIPKDYFFNGVATQLVIMLALLAVVWTIAPASKFGVCWRAHLLGCLLNVGLMLAMYSTAYESFGLYLVAVSFFHWSEYMMQSIYNPKTTTVGSYMLYHSNAYVVAVAASLLEYFAEQHFYPEMKQIRLISNFGITIVIAGEILRKISMITAKSNFNHHIQYAKDDDHELVMHGVYSLFR